MVHWGADLGRSTAGGRDQDRRLSGIDAIAANVVDEPVRVALLPEHWTGWVGRPGISGARAGQGWSPKFRDHRAAGRRRTGPGSPRGRLLHLDGPALLEVDAVDPVAELELTLRFELLVGGLIRSQVELRNLGDAVLRARLRAGVSRPVGGRRDPRLRRSLGQGARFRSAVALNVGTHLREGRKGRTGAGRRDRCCTSASRASRFADGEVWAVHTGWSGNHTHYAERLSTGEQVIGGGELLLPEEVVLERGRRLHDPWIYAAYGVGLDAVARRFHRYLRSRDQHPSVDRPVTINVWEAVYFDHDLDKLVRAGRGGGRARRRAVRPGRRLVRLPPQRPRRSG